MNTPIIEYPVKPCPWCASPPAWALYQPERPWFLVRCGNEQCAARPAVGNESDAKAVVEWNARSG